PEEPEHEHQRQAGARGQLEVRQPVAVRELEEPRGDEIGRVANVEEDDAELVNEEDRERERELGPAARLWVQPANPPQPQKPSLFPANLSPRGAAVIADGAR